MKRSVIIILMIFLISPALSQTPSFNCNLKINLLNQDPYPGVPNNNLKIVFQIVGVDNPACGKVKFEIIEEFPFSLIPGETSTVDIQSGIYSRGVNSFVLAPFELKVSDQSPDGENKLSTKYTINSGEITFLKDFNITIESAETDFEISVKDYNYKTNIITFEILNIGEKDSEALTIEVPLQDNLQIKGTNRNIIGSLDSNEDTTFTFEATPQEGEIKLIVYYNDEIKVRHSIEKSIYFNPIYFKDRKRDEIKIPLSTYFFVSIIIIIAIIWIRFIIRKNKKRKRAPLY